VTVSAAVSDPRQSVAPGRSLPQLTGTIYFSSDDNSHLFVINPDGSVKWQYSIDEQTTMTPSLTVSVFNRGPN
jgi:outer membrane protein assembly factor BamB